MSRNASPKPRKLAILIPCLNEAQHIGAVIDACKKALPAARIYICDNGSTDDTSKIAKQHGAIVHSEPKHGKGRALKKLFSKVNADCYVLIDGDDSCRITNLSRMVKKILDGDDIVVGARSNGISADPIRRAGNKLARVLLRVRTGLKFTDPLCGYRALSKKFVKNFPCQSAGFGIEAEMSIFAAEHHMRYSELPIKVKSTRKSSSKLKTVKDGLRIFRVLCGMNVRMALTACIFSVLFTSTQIIGSKISVGSDVLAAFTGHDVINFIIWSIISFFAVCFIFQLYDALRIRFAKQDKTRKASPTWKFWITISVIMFLVWFSLFMLFIPGVVTADSANQLHQVFGTTPLNNDHPILHTIFIGIFIFIGGLFSPSNATVGVMIFSIAQMAILAIILGYICFWLAKNTRTRIVGIVAAIYFSINPMVAYSSFAMLKDTLFSATIIFLITLLVDIVRSKGVFLNTNSGMRKFLLAALLVVFLRNNGILISAIVMVGVSLTYGKLHRAFILKSLAVIIFMHLALTLFSSLVTQNHFTETAAVPLQQIAHTSKHGTISQSQKEFFNNILDTNKMAESYDPTSVDYIKWHDDYNKEYLNNHKTDFILNWAELGINNIPEYLASYALLTEPLWHIGNSDWAFDYYGNVGDLGDIGISEINLFGEDQRRVATESLQGFQKTPLGGIILDAGFLIWCTWLIFAYMIYKKDSKIILTPLLMLWLGLMLTAPAPSNLRYCFAFCLALPIILSAPLLSTSEKLEPRK